MRKTIIGIGNALVDALVRVSNDDFLAKMGLPKGSMQLIDELRFEEISRHLASMKTTWATGGSAGNTILALARLGAHPAFIGKVGDDQHGQFFANNCRECHIQAHLLPSKLTTGVASTLITPDGQRTFATHLGAAATLTADDLRSEWLEGHHYLYIEGYLVQNHDLIERATELAHKAGLKVCLDLASYNIVEAERDFFAYLLERVDIVFANEEEAHAFTGKGPQEALQQLASICEVAIVKVGRDGAWAQCGEEIVHCPAAHVPTVIDTTAAGDFFAGGFLHAHALGYSLPQCLQAGSILAGEVIQVIGTQLPATTWNSIQQQISDL